MTPQEYTLLDRIVSKLEWVQDEAAYPEVYNSNEWIFDALYTITSSLNNGYSCWFRGKPVGKGSTEMTDIEQLEKDAQWLENYSHQMMEEGVCDRTAEKILDISKNIRDHMEAMNTSPLPAEQPVLKVPSGAT